MIDQKDLSAISIAITDAIRALVRPEYMLRLPTCIIYFKISQKKIVASAEKFNYHAVPHKKTTFLSTKRFDLCKKRTYISPG